MAESAGAGWNRKEFNVRLSKRRREQLVAFALAGDSLTVALDRALAATGTGRPSDADLAARIDAMEELIEAQGDERRAEAAAVAGELRAMRSTLDALRESLEELARNELEEF
ncbi:MAG: hypothetical protein V4669_11575 [Pseudomonadota bacterium]